MSRTQRITTIALLVGATCSGAHAQVPADVRSIKPIMMLLVDTSGSMERMTDDSRTPVCSNNPALDVNEKNRWTVTLEALTGTFSNFSCDVVDRTNDIATTEMDYGYYLPHFEITSTTQATDGIMDSFLHRLKFGLMTFDGAGTTLNGDTLVATHTWMSDNDFRTEARGPEGMYSYGPNKRLSFPNCPEDYAINAGARSADAPSGGLVGVGTDGNDVLTTNANIQAALRNIRPFGSTPLAAMFDDLDYYLTTDDNVREGSDPFYECRNRYALLITDSAGDANELFRDARFNCQAEDPGTPGRDCATNNATARNKYTTGDSEVYSDPGSNPAGDCECPYDTEQETVRKLVSGTNPKLHKLFIVAFNVQDQAALDHLDALAAVGESDAAFKAASQTQLRARLSELMSAVQGDATTRSVPVSVDTGASVLLNGKQYEITSGFKVGSNTDDPWEGLLYRRRIGCSETGTVAQQDLSETEGDMFHTRLNAQSDGARVISSMAAGSKAAAKATLFGAGVASGSFTGDTQNDQGPGSASITGTLPTDATVDSERSATPISVADVPFNGSINPIYFGDVDGVNGPGQAADRDLIVSYVRGLSRPGKKLADIYYSSPVVLPPLTGSAGSVNSVDERLTQSRVNLAAAYGGQGRPGVVFVGTNDGILHAFNLDTAVIDSVEYQAGHEFWGFVPPALFSKMHTAAVPTHVSMFDGTPVLADISSPFTPGNAVVPTYSTVLVSNVRGAPAFVALDITRPETLKPMWQFSDEYMGPTVGRASVTHVVMDWNGTIQQRAVAILPGGSGEEAGTVSAPCSLDNTKSKPASGTSRDQGRCWKLQGRALYVVDVLTGALIQRFDPRHFNAPMTGSVAAENPGLGVSQSAYLTDQDGILWRLSMVNPDPSKWRVQPVWDLFGEKTYKEGRASTFPPVVTHDPSGNAVVVVGTGDLDNLIDDVQHRVISLTEHRSITDGEIAFDEDTMVLNWKEVLEESESVTGPLVLFQDTVYFGTFKSISEPDNYCAFGNSRFWGAHVRLAGTTPERPKPMIGVDRTGNDGIVDDYELYTDAFDDTLVLGVSITQQPVCVAGAVENDPNGLNTTGNGTQVQRFDAQGQASGGGFTLRALAGGSGGTIPNGGEIKQIEQKLFVTESTSIASWASSVE